MDKLKKVGLTNCRIEGINSSDWKLVDTNDIIVHIFHPKKTSGLVYKHAQ